MLTIRRAHERGHASHGWLDSWHLFSFAEYYDPRWMGWGNLRVINEDRIDPGTGFGRHGHRDMEIVSYVLEGALTHADSMGNTTTIVPGQIQRMTAGTGVLHSEQNANREGQTHFLQIWIEPAAHQLPPGYAQRDTGLEAARGQLKLLAAPASQDLPEVMPLHADAAIYAGLLDGADTAELTLAEGRKAAVFVARGSLQVNGQQLHAGDTAFLADEAQLQLDGASAAEVLVFDLAA